MTAVSNTDINNLSISYSNSNSEPDTSKFRVLNNCGVNRNLLSELDEEGGEESGEPLSPGQIDQLYSVTATALDLTSIVKIQNKEKKASTITHSTNDTEHSLGLESLLARADDYEKNKQYSDAAKVYERIKSTEAPNNNAMDKLRGVAIRKLAFLHLYGLGANKDKTKARDLFLLASIQGDPIARNLIKQLKSQG